MPTELKVIVKATTLVFTYVSMLLLVPSCIAMQYQEQPHQVNAKDENMFLVSALPRKLGMFDQEVKGHGDQRSISSCYKHKKVNLSSGAYFEQQNGMQRSSKWTWKEWIEGTDSSQFFTMDYSHVRRRRPIHNKSLPVGP